MPAPSHGLRRRILIGSVILLFLLVALLLLALPFRNVPGHADAAQSELTQAAQALKGGDIDAATLHTRAARDEVDDVNNVANGVSGRVWSLVPVARPGMLDVRRLATALHEVTSALEIVIDTYPEVSGDDATLFSGDGGVDIPTLERLLTNVSDLSEHVGDAREALDEVDGTTMVIGDRITTARNAALEEVAPLQKSLEEMGPLLDTLPSMLGADGEKTYVVAMLNPSEIRFSGGAMLTFAGMKFDNGEMTRGPSRDTESNPRAFRPIQWKAVKDNPFHGPYRQRITHANLAPSWPVAGEELLRAWAQVKNYEADGVVALDVVALSRLLQVTGPLQVPGFGEVTAENLVATTVGSYDTFTTEEFARRKALNRELIPAFTERLFGTVDFSGTVSALADAARSRHFALYFRDKEAQDGATQLGFDGDLSSTSADYIGMFTQNLVPAKSDYWQRKVISSDVSVRADGSAKVKLNVELRNEAEPLPFGVPYNDYTVRDISMEVGSFLPQGVKLREAALDGESFEPELGDYFGRPYFTKAVLLPQGQSATLTLEYDVPAAATVEDGRLVYALDFDNHPTVRPEELSVTVHWPKGFRNADLPEGWVPGKGRSARFDAPQVPGSERWSLSASSS